eukprot:TRINITY_DN2682_c0_g1_i1.p1 TRINITY_DN2682_c0_g1~~TRINITY_DN2682_c0_g1_i1.p1  ORF type:complete len:313 (+),score=94.66 TRINITY_DN2682_c0_g1_i1:51-941(+)
MECLSEVFSHVEAIRAAIAGEVSTLELMRAQLDEDRARLEEERRLFEVEKKALRDRLQRGTGLVTPLSGNVVELNVGGVQYTTSLTTLMADPDSELAALFRTPSEIPLDADGRFFLDYAGETFSYILKYLRGEKFFVRKGDPIVAEVYSLAHRLGLAGFKKIIEKVLMQQKKEVDREKEEQQQQQQQHQQQPVQHEPSPKSPPKEQHTAAQSEPHTGADVHMPKKTPPTTGVHGAMIPQGFDPALASTLQNVLERQRTKEAAARGAAALEQVRSEEATSQAENQWERYWQRLVSTP